MKSIFKAISESDLMIDLGSIWVQVGVNSRSIWNLFWVLDEIWQRFLLVTVSGDGEGGYRKVKK